MGEVVGAIFIVIGVLLLFFMLLVSIWWGLCLFLFSVSFGMELFFNHGPLDALFKCWELGKTMSDSM